MGTRPGCDKRYRATEYAQKSHVSFDEGHVHESTFGKADELVVHAQADVGGRKDDCLGIMYLRLLDSDELVEGYSCVSPQEPVDPCDFLSLVFGISGPGNGGCSALAAYFYEVAGRYSELLHCRIFVTAFTVTDVPLLCINYSDMNFFCHLSW